MGDGHENRDAWQKGPSLVPTVSEMALEVVTKAPSVVLQDAKKAAEALQDVIRKKPRPVMIHGEHYLEFEDWQTLGQFYGYTVQTGDAVPFVLEGIAGAKAKAILFDSQGRIMGGAESYCMRDEAHWKDKPWFQLASMAQTRAGAKALRNRLALVAVLAGYRPTPAEEMPREIESEAETPTHTTSAPLQSFQQKQGEASTTTLDFGKHQGKTLSDESIPSDYLIWLVSSLAGWIQDQNKKSFRTQNEALLKAVNDELHQRKGNGIERPTVATVVDDFSLAIERTKTKKEAHTCYMRFSTMAGLTGDEVKEMDYRFQVRSAELLS